MTDEEFSAFIANVDRSSGPTSCHLWTGPKSVAQGGYGTWNGQGAHRVAYALKHGEIPERAVIRHKCDNPPCCNPSHLEIGTHADNRADCVSKKRHAQGQKHGKSKLTHRQVRFIRTHHKGWTHAQIAEKYGVARSTVTKILAGETYPGVGSARFAMPKNSSQTVDDDK